MKKLILLTTIISFFGLAVFAQRTFKVGEKVEVDCSCDGQRTADGWTIGVIEGIESDGSYRVRYNTATYDYRSFTVKSIRKSGAGEKLANQNQLRSAFLSEASKYRETVYSLMMIHDENLVAGQNKYGPPVNAADWTRTMKELGELDDLCKTKYAGMTNDPNNPWKNDLGHLPATWCEIASRRNEYEQKGRNLALSQQMGLSQSIYLKKLNEMLNKTDPYIGDDFQMLMFETAKWRTDFQKETAKTQKEIGASLPDEFFTEIEAKGKELREKTEREAPNRTFKIPLYHDTAIETFIKGKYATQLKGVQIQKIGMDYTTWKVWKNSLGIPISQTKRGRVLVKVPNRPFCQEQEFVIVKEYTGGGKYGAIKSQDALGGGGLFMSCQ